MEVLNINLGNGLLETKVPSTTTLLSMKKPMKLREYSLAVKNALDDSRFGLNLDSVIKKKVLDSPDAEVVIVISDNTRPVPYKGEQGILWPIIKKLLEHGIPGHQILVLVATGTHRPLSEEELHDMLDPRIFSAGVRIENHDCDDDVNLVYLGDTPRGSKIYINKSYVNADLKILTGLVESHCMAGFSGGRKSICPGLIGRKSTYVFHGAPMLSSAQTRDLVLKGNPCHEEALYVARKAGADYIVNVTLDHEFDLTGVFAGDLEDAHKRAAEHVKEYVSIPLEKEYDIVVTHGGFVGINHYQVAKAGVAALPALKENGRLIIVSNTTDQEQVGSLSYRAALQLLTAIGADNFERLLFSPDWTFMPDQWQAQMWAKVLKKTSLANIVFFSPSMSASDYRFLPSYDGNLLLPEDKRYTGDFGVFSEVIESAISEEIDRIKLSENRNAAVAFLLDGPYGIPLRVNGTNVSV